MAASQVGQTDPAQMRDQVDFDVTCVGAQRGGAQARSGGQPVPQPVRHGQRSAKPPGQPLRAFSNPRSEVRNGR